MHYFDSSAIAKLALAEDESAQLRAFLADGSELCLSSVIARTEVMLAIARVSRSASATISDIAGAMQLQGFAFRLVDVDARVAQAAAALGTQHGLRTLDAIHVATAVAFRPRLACVITYDLRMATACRALGLPVVSPGA